MRYSEAGKHLADEDIVVEEGDGLGEDGIIMVQGQGNDPLIEDGVGQDIDQEDFPLGDREVEEADGDFVGWGVQDRGHSEMEGACFMECLISSTSQNSPCCFRIASACPSNWGQCCTCSARHGTLFPFSVLTLNLRLRANGRCRAVQARLCRKSCGHVISLGPYLLSMTSSPYALVAMPGFSSFHFRFAPLISAPFAIRCW